MAVAAAWLWLGEPRGYLLSGASIVMGAIESISIAADQWYGHAADPASTVVPAVLTPIFAAPAVLSLAVAWLLLRGLAAARGRAPVGAACQLSGRCRTGRVDLVQLLVMQRSFFLQAVIAALGIVELALVRVWQQAGTASPAPRQHRPVLHG